MLKKFLTLILFLIISNNNIVYCQYYFDETIHFGGVLGSGYSPSNSELVFNGNIQIGSISSGSTISKAYLFASRVGKLNPISLQFNSINFILDSSNVVPSNFNSNIYGGNSGIHVIDVSEFISASQINYPISSSTIQSTSSNRFSDFYLVIFYNNPALNRMNTSIILNDQDFGPQIIYSLNNLNIIDTNFDIGLCLSSGYICDDLIDGETAFVNNVSIGNFGGNNPNSGNCGGPFGSFLYENNTFSGLNGNDPNLNFNSFNLVKKINNEITSNNSINLKFESIEPTNYSNSIWINILTYTTPCDTFSVSVPNDTTVCKGAQIQLNVTGGQSYEWASTSQATGIVPGLSCSDCPNPVFTADSSMTYTVRIWNNDSCSVVRPVKINVAKDPAIENFAITSAECGTNTGKVIATPISASYAPISYTLDNLGSQSSNTFNNLGAGAHQLHLEDARGCSSDTTFYVPQTISAQANFQTTPLVGFTPHDIYLLNTSTNASDYLWQIDGANQGSDLTHYTFNDQGTFEITLIAWKYDPSCSDTTSKIAYVQPQLIIPTAFTPDNDLINDTWEIPHLDEMYPENIVQIYNRWGELLFESQAGNYNSNPWNGTYNNKPLPIGSYYFIIQTNDKVAGMVQGTVSLVFSY